MRPHRLPKSISRMCWSLLLLGCGSEDGADGQTYVDCDDATGGVEVEIDPVEEFCQGPNCDENYENCGGGSAIPQGGLMAVHAAHLHTGDVITWAQRLDQRLSPASSETSWAPLDTNDCRPFTAPSSVNNFFCAGFTSLPDGRLFVTGGGGGSGDDATAAVGIFDPEAQMGVHWEDLPPMNVSRWYPSVVLLPDGRLAVGGGAAHGPEDCVGGVCVGICDDETPPNCYGSGNACMAPNDCEPVCQSNVCSHNGQMCSVNADCRAPGNKSQTVDIYDPKTGGWTSLPQAPIALVTNYPALFLLPDGNIFHAAGEANGGGAARNGFILDMTTETWLDQTVWQATTPTEYIGGVAVMYEPGKVMRAGGGTEPRPDTEVIDLSGGYLTSKPNWSAVGEMCDRRHYHSMVLLPDGTVLAAGGNRWSNGSSGDDPEGSCAAASVSCSVNADCNAFPPAECVPAGPDVSDKVCNPHNNACFATNTVEIWDPETFTWRKARDPVTQQDVELENERMYHSTALLMPEGEVVIMGGGQRQGLETHHDREVITPPYLLSGGQRPVVSNMPDGQVLGALDCGMSSLTLELDPGAPAPARVTLVKLGAVTHHNDVSQRFIELCREGDLEPCVYQEDDDTLEVFGPCALSDMHQHGAIAPPGYYMLFVLSDDGVPSLGQYVQIQEQSTAGLERWSCAPDSLSSLEASCAVDPTGGCPTMSLVQTSVALPTSGSMTGWTVVTNAGAVEDVANPTTAELDMIKALCVEACELEWAGQPEVSASCDDSDAFAEPTHVGSLGTRAEDFIPSTRENGQGLFSSSLSCTFTHTCCEEFDENICSATNGRPTLQSDRLDVAPETRRRLRSTGQGNKAQFEISTNTGRYSSAATGEIGYSFCEDGAGTACPFYLSDFSMDATSSITVQFNPGGGVQTKVIGNLQARLVQPAFGQADPGTGGWTDVAFPAGALFVEVEFDVDGHHYKTRRATTVDVFGEAQEGDFRATSLPISITVPVDGADVSVTVELDIYTDTNLERSPTVSINVPSTVSCGAPFALDSSATDPDGDLDVVRWRVGGELLAPSTTTLTFSSGSRVLSATAFDERGAATTVKKTISCS